MEKTISIEERIRRAEEIYARRKNDSVSTSIPYARVSIGEKKRANSLRKMFIQICVCAMIYMIFYTMKNGDYIFTPQLTERVKQVLEYDMNIQNMSEDVLKYINEIRNKDVVIPEENKAVDGETEAQEQIIEKKSDEKQETLPEESSNNEEKTEDILGVTEEAVYTEEASSISQTQIDADYIKQNYSIIKPLTGTITSRFGNRNPTTESVPKYHTGIDIAREVGTKIIAAMEGKVTQISSSGDYRKSFENSKWRSNYFVCTLQ